MRLQGPADLARRVLLAIAGTVVILVAAVPILAPAALGSLADRMRRKGRGRPS